MKNIIYIEDTGHENVGSELMEKKKYRIIIWDVNVRSKDMELDETELDTLVDKLKSKEVPPSFEVREILEDNWQRIVTEHYTDEWFYLNKKTIK